MQSNSEHTPLESSYLKQLQAICQQSGQVLYQPADCLPYGCDNSKQYALPDAVVLVQTHEEVMAVVKLCRKHHLPITPRGRGTNTTGAAVPIHGGVVVSLEKMDRILELDTTNRTLRVQPGVTNQAIQDYCASHRLFWPPDPGSAAYCTVGGNLACNAAGPRALKYGTTRDNTLRLKAVAGTGETLKTGALTTKSVAGLDLTRLLIGSEGTLAIITEAVLQLRSLPPCTQTLQLGYATVEDALQAVCDIMQQYETPSAIEFLDDTCVELLRQHSELHIDKNINAMLIVEADGSEAAVSEAIETIHSAAKNDRLCHSRRATQPSVAESLWSARKMLSPVLRNFKPCKINEDIVVPISALVELVHNIRIINERYQVNIVNFGHAGNGNLHVNILYHPEQEEKAQQALADIFSLVLKLNGSISGEHGIGLSKRNALAQELDSNTINIMRELTRVLDPDDILNSGKALPP